MPGGVVEPRRRSIFKPVMFAIIGIVLLIINFGLEWEVVFRTVICNVLWLCRLLYRLLYRNLLAVSRLYRLTIYRLLHRLSVACLYRLAVCSQIDFIAINGIDSITGGGDNGFTVGKVSVHGVSGTKTGGAMSANISPAALTYLEQTGLMNPAVPVVGGW